MERKSAADLLTSVDNLFTTKDEREEANRETVKSIVLQKCNEIYVCISAKCSNDVESSRTTDIIML